MLGDEGLRYDVMMGGVLPFIMIIDLFPNSNKFEKTSHSSNNIKWVINNACRM